MAAFQTFLLAAAGSEVENFPLVYQVGCILFSALFFWTFCIVRDPRGWRRLYQARFSNPQHVSVNKNKRMDEIIKSYGIFVSMAFFVVAVTCFVVGITYRHRHTNREMTREERMRVEDLEKLGGSKPLGR